MAHWVDIAIDIKEIYFDRWVWGHPFSVTGLVRKLNSHNHLNFILHRELMSSASHLWKWSNVYAIVVWRNIKRSSLVMMIFGMMSKPSVRHDKVRSELGAEPIVTKALLQSVTPTYWSCKCLGIVITVGSLVIYTTSRGRLN